MHPRITITVFVVGFVLRLVPLALPFEFRGPDSVGYLAPAASLVAGAGYADEHGEPTAARPPGYPLFLAGIYAVAGGPTDVGARVAQAALGALAALCVMGLLASRPTTRPVALAGGLLVACDPIAVGQSPFLLREVLLLALLAALLLALARLRGRRRFAAAALLLAALALTHQLYALLGGFLAAVDLLAARKSRRLSRLAPWFAVGLVVLLAIVLWARRNERVVGHFSATATANAVPARELWLTTACSNTWLSGDLATGFQHLAFAEERRLVDTLGLDGAKSELYRRAAANWTEHPLRSLARLARQNLWYWIEVPGAVRLAAHPRLHVARWFLLAFHWARLAAAAAGLLFLLRVGWRHHRYLLATLAFFALAPALLYPVPRYLGPAAPLLDVLAVLGVGASRGVVRTP
jgi:4-amino-4-deoxy-L-arabinose transferase-like glycosyltransferase